MIASIEVYIFLLSLVTLLVEHNKISVAAVDRMCRENHYEFCRVREGTFPYSIPSNVEEFHIVCNLINTYFPCFKEYGRRCFNIYEPNFDIYFAMCHNDSFAYKETIKNLKCFENVDKYNNEETCQGDNDKIFEALTESEELAWLRKTLPYSDVHDIINDLVMLNDLDCFLKLLDECPDTYDIVIEIFKLYYSSSTDKWMKDVKYILDDLDLENDKKMSIKETISKYEKSLSYGRSLSL